MSYWTSLFTHDCPPYRTPTMTYSNRIEIYFIDRKLQNNQNPLIGDGWAFNLVGHLAYKNAPYVEKKIKH